MKTILTIGALCVCALQTFAQPSAPDDRAKETLKARQSEMFRYFGDGDTERFSQLTGDDYVTINADGSYMHKDQMLEHIPKFAGSTSKIVEEETRYYDNIAITTGRAHFFFGESLVADVYFTQIWAYREGQWMFIGWQGTMKGEPMK